MLSLLPALAPFLGLSCLLGLGCSRLAARLSEDRLEQLIVSMLLALFWLTTASLITAWAGYYHLAGMALLLTPLLLAALRWGRRPAGSLAGLVADGLLGLVRHRLAWLEGLPHLLFLIGLLRVIAQPPRAGDALLYHLPRAVYWLQDQGFAAHAIPGDWTYYTFFPPAGDLLWAWTMLAGAGDALLWLAYLFVWTMLTANLQALCQAAGLSRERGSLAVAAILCVPALLLSACAAYVDVLLAALLLTALTAALKAEREQSNSWLLLGGLAATLAACTKFSGLPMLGMYLLYAALLMWPQGRRALRPALLLTGTLLPLLIWMLWTWRHHGSLIWPFQLFGGKLAWLAGDTRMLEQFAADQQHRSLAALVKAAAKLVLFPLNLGWLSWLLAPLAVVSLLFRHHKITRRPLILMLGFALLPLLAMFLPDSNALITTWVAIAGRHLLITMALLILFAASLQGQLARPVLQLSILVHSAQAVLVAGWTSGDLSSLPRVVGPLLLALPVIAALLWSARRWLDGSSAQLLGLGLLVLVYLLACLPQRERWRHDHYALGDDLRSYEFHANDARAHHQAWRLLDQQAPLNIGYSADLQFDRYSWFGYPYFGTRLQNRLVYVGPSRREAPGRDTPEALAQFRTSLGKAGLDYLVLSGELPDEQRVAEALGLVPKLESSHGRLTVYAVSKAARIDQ